MQGNQRRGRGTRGRGRVPANTETDLNGISARSEYQSSRLQGIPIRESLAPVDLVQPHYRSRRNDDLEDSGSYDSQTNYTEQQRYGQDSFDSREYSVSSRSIHRYDDESHENGVVDKYETIRQKSQQYEAARSRVSFRSLNDQGTSRRDQHYVEGHYKSQEVDQYLERHDYYEENTYDQMEQSPSGRSSQNQDLHLVSQVDQEHAPLKFKHSQEYGNSHETFKRYEEAPNTSSHYLQQYEGSQNYYASSPQNGEGFQVSSRDRESARRSQTQRLGRDSEEHCTSQNKSQVRPMQQSMSERQSYLDQQLPVSPQPSTASSVSVSDITKAYKQLSVKDKDRSPIIQHGTEGKPINLTANYIILSLSPDKGIYEYSVDFDPEVHSKGFRFKLLHQYDHIIGKARTFDGSTLYIPFQLKEETLRLKVQHPTSEEVQFLTITFRRRREMGECVHFYNVLLKRIMNELKFARIGRHHYDPMKAIPIPQYRLEIWPGFVTAVDEFEGGVMLNCDASSKLLRTQTVLELMSDIGRTTKQENYRSEVINTIVGSSVLTRYNNRTYRVDDIDFEMTPFSTFTLQDGTEISFCDYYKKQYGLTITVTDQPVLISRDRVKILSRADRERLVVLIPEFSYMTGLTEQMTKDFKVMKSVATYSRITPMQRHYALKQYIDSVNNNENAKNILLDWGLKLNSDTIHLQGRVAAGEQVFFGNERSCGSSADWSKSAAQNPLFHAVDLLNWAILYTRGNERYAQDFLLLFKRITPAMGMKVIEPKHFKIDNDRTESYCNLLRRVIAPMQLQLVVIIFPTPRDDRYSAVKKVCCVESAIPSQVINSKTLAKPTGQLRSIVQKIALQINVKLGGSLWSITNPFRSVMVVGIDSYHDTVSRCKSVGGFVSSLNHNLTRYYSRVCIQNSGQEFIDMLKVCFIQALERYYSFNNNFPERIIVYRDGVSDNELQIVVNHEARQFVSCFADVAPDYNPKFSIIVTQKRINTKFMELDETNGIGNPPPGTIVDHTVTRRFLYDFFLVSQSVRQGTVNPTHYIVTYDTSNLKPDYVQRFTYKMCHMYYNWTGTIRVPAQCLYAHRIAQHVGMHLRQEPHPELAERLFYL